MGDLLGFSKMWAYCGLLLVIVPFLVASNRVSVSFSIFMFTLIGVHKIATCHSKVFPKILEGISPKISPILLIRSTDWLVGFWFNYILDNFAIWGTSQPGLFASGSTVCYGKWSKKLRWSPVKSGSSEAWRSH